MKYRLTHLKVLLKAKIELHYMKTGYLHMSHLNLNLNSLLVKRQINNPSPGAVTGGN